MILLSTPPRSPLKSAVLTFILTLALVYLSFSFILWDLLWPPTASDDGRAGFMLCIAAFLLPIYALTGGFND